MEDLISQFSLTESILVGIIVSVITSAIRVYLKKSDEYQFPFWLTMLVTLICTLLFIDKLPSWSWTSIKTFLLQFITIFSFATLFWKTLGKTVVSKFLDWMKDKVEGFLGKS